MNYNFTEGVRTALAGARDEAFRLGHDYVGTEHILLGLVREEGAAALLRGLGVAPEEVRSAVERRVLPGTGMARLGELPYTSRAKKVLELSMSEARHRKDDNVGTEHLLAGLLREEASVGAEILRELGVTLEVARSGGPAAPGAVVSEPSRFRVVVDDASDRSIYEQIVARITEAVATGELRAGERLPTVRRLADELDIAPGTVARAYGELERSGVVVTEGARGTRVAERARPPVAASERLEALQGLLRSVAVAAFHLGATAAELRAALEEAMRGIFGREDPEPRQ